MRLCRTSQLLHRRFLLASATSSLKQSEANFDIKTHTEDVRNLAFTIENARKSRSQIEPPTFNNSLSPNDHSTAYSVAAAVCGLRRQDGARVVGRKIGFTNTRIWPEYNVDRANWGYMYHDTVSSGIEMLDLSFSKNLQPKIEPEIVFHFSESPSPDMDDHELLSCVDWLSLGFEIVHSIYPGWKFGVADTTAAGALHGHLVLGSRQKLDKELRNKILPQLYNFDVELYRNFELIDVGHATAVLGGPLKALRHLIELLSNQDEHPQVSSGELVTTGTLTRAISIGPEDICTAQVTGIDGLKSQKLEFM